jgi:hypothetical protein
MTDLYKGMAVFVFIALAGIVAAIVRSVLRDHRDGPILDAIRKVAWTAPDGELKYRDGLALYLNDNISTEHKAEQPLLTGTKVDLWVRVGKSDFYVTIKMGLDNQERLRLQGEIEDIITDCRKVDRGDVRIIVVIGVHADKDRAKLASHIQVLKKHVRERVTCLRHDKARQQFEMDVVTVPIGEARPSQSPGDANSTTEVSPSA